jgi:hypothetical protein
MGEGSTWGADGKVLTGLKSGQLLPGTPETEMSAGGTYELQIHQSRTHCQREAAPLPQAWEPRGLNRVQFLLLSSCITWTKSLCLLCLSFSLIACDTAASFQDGATWHRRGNAHPGHPRLQGRGARTDLVQWVITCLGSQHTVYVKSCLLSSIPSVLVYLNSTSANHPNRPFLFSRFALSLLSLCFNHTEGSVRAGDITSSACNSVFLHYSKCWRAEDSYPLTQTLLQLSPT